jgi:hypothetical protein
VLANVNGETSPTNTKGAPKFLLALNGGSDSITVLRNDPAGLTVVDTEDSQGTRPISITINRGVAYVLNAGSFMCAGVGEPSTLPASSPRSPGPPGR